MKNELTCGVVADLLPSFVEGSTFDETNRAVETHVADCPACAAKLAAMRGPEAEPSAETEKEVDYLKMVKKKTCKRVLTAVFCTVLVIVLGIAMKLFVIGEPASVNNMSYSTAVRDGALHLKVSSTSSANAYWAWKLDNKEGIFRISAREGLVSSLHQSGSSVWAVPLDGVKEVYLCGRLVWQDGEIIDRNILRIYETRTPYVGDAPALGQMANALEIRELLGEYTMELQTSQRPYDWTLMLQAKVNGPTDSLLPYLGPQMLALVDNLDQITWSYPSQEPGHNSKKVLTVGSVNAHLSEWFEGYNKVHGTEWITPNSIKDCAKSAADFQRLQNVLQYRYETRRMGIDDMGLLT